MKIINDILWFLKDGKWHSTEEITKKMGASKTKTEIALEFLSEYKFIQRRKDGTKAKLQNSTRKFIIEILRLEQKID